MGKPKLFNEVQEQYILDNFQEISNAELAKRLGESYTAKQINSWLQHRGIKRDICLKSNSIFSISDIDYIKQHYSYMTCAQIGEVLGFSAQQIKGKVDKLNLDNKKRSINDNYFSEINTPIKAYFLGYIYADGWIVYNEEKSNYEFGMQLQTDDRYILDRLNFELGNQNVIYHNQSKCVMVNSSQIAHCGESDTLRVYSKQLVEDLIKHGIETNKSQKDTYPVVHSSLFFDYLRGYIDGDGCYYVNNGQTYMHITASSICPLEYIQYVLNEHNIKTQIYSENQNKFRLMCTNFSSMEKLINSMYYEKDLICLSRKYNKIKKFLGLTEQKCSE